MAIAELLKAKEEKYKEYEAERNKFNQAVIKIVKGMLDIPNSLYTKGFKQYEITRLEVGETPFRGMVLISLFGKRYGYDLPYDELLDSVWFNIEKEIVEGY